MRRKTPREKIIINVKYVLYCNIMMDDHDFWWKDKPI